MIHFFVIDDKEIKFDPGAESDSESGHSGKSSDPNPDQAARTAQKPETYGKPKGCPVPGT